MTWPRSSQRGSQAHLLRQSLPHLLLILTVLMWSGNFIAGRALRDEVDPVTLIFWRWVIALLLLLPFGMPSLARSWPAIREHWRVLLGLAVTGVGLFHYCVYSALRTTPALNSVLFLSMTPLVIVLLNRLLFGEPIRWPQAAGLAVSLVGVTILITEGAPATLTHLRLGAGDLWMMLAVPVWALYSVLLRRRPAGLPGLGLLIPTVALGLLCVAPFYGLALSGGAALPTSPPALLGIGYVAVFASVVAYLCWNRGVAEIGPNRAGAYLHLMPLFSAGLGIALLGERVMAYHLIGAGLILGGVVLASQRRAS